MITGDFFQTLEVDTDLYLNRGMDSKFLTDLSSHIQYKCKNVNTQFWWELGAPVTVRSLNLPLSNTLLKLMFHGKFHTVICLVLSPNKQLGKVQPNWQIVMKYARIVPLQTCWNCNSLQHNSDIIIQAQSNYLGCTHVWYLHEFEYFQNAVYPSFYKNYCWSLILFSQDVTSYWMTLSVYLLLPNGKRIVPIANVAHCKRPLLFNC